MTNVPSTLPSVQQRFPGLPELSPEQLYFRREGVFLLLSGLFLGTLAMLNILGITRFIKLAEIDLAPGTPGTAVFAVAVGVLPYPLTFLCTDFICELYGKARANLVVLVGLVLNVWVMFILWLGGALPGFEARDPATGELVRDAAGNLPMFFEMQRFAFGAVGASMAAYLAAQFVDVYVFHYWKSLTRGRHLWLRNNGSTLISQMVDTVAVILITYIVGGLAGVIDDQRPALPQLALLIATGYAFKAACALLDTIPFYVGVHHLSRFLRLPRADHGHNAEP